MATTKYTIFSIIFFGYAMFSYNRKGVSFAIPKLLEEGLENEKLGLILSSQNLAYAISKFLGGIISDRLSSRVLFSTGLLISGLSAVLFSMANTVTLYTLIWFLNGLAQGVGWPAIAKLLKNWFEPAELGTWWSLSSASANLAGCVAPFLASYIITSYGWRSSLVFVGALTILSSLISFMFILDAPPLKSNISSPTKDHKRKKSSSENIKQQKEDKKTAKKLPRSSLMLLLNTKFIWVISICYLVSSSIKTSVTDWSQMYLISDCQQSSLVASTFIGSVEFGGFIGGIAAGYLSDKYMKYSLRGGKTLPPTGHPRMTVALIFAFITGISLHLFYYHVSQDTSTIFINQLGILIGASLYGQIALFGVVATQSVVSEMSGTAHAIAALAANIGSIAAGLPFATIAKYYTWSDVFFILELMMILTIIFMLIMRNTSYRIAALDADKKTK